MLKRTLALCIPAYNAAWCLPRLLKSATAQDTRFEEVLVYDDASTDDTSAVAAAHGARVIRGAVNRGCAHGKNVLAKAASTDWLHFHDADDELLSNFSRSARTWIGLSDAPDVVLLSYEYRDRNSDQLLAVRVFSDQRVRVDPVAFAIREQINNFGLYQRAPFVAAGGYDDDPLVLFNEDVAMHVRLAVAGLSFRAEEIPTAVSFRVEGSMSRANRARCISAQYHVMRKAAARVAHSHGRFIAARLWEIASVAAACDDWATAKLSVDLAVELGGRITNTGSRSFRMLAAAMPFEALRLRETAIRALKPHLRR